jgi:sialidase-1
MVAGAKAVGCTSPPQPPATEACVYKAFRIPGFVNAGGTLLAFAEGRATGCADMSGYHDMMLRSSTDQGRSWGALRTIVDARALWRSFSAAHGLAVWDPTPIFDSTTGTTFLFFGGPGRTKGHHWDIWQMSSQDKGRSWSAPVNMSSSCGRQGDGSSKACCGLSGDTPSDGVGVQLSTGRLVIPL